MVYTRSFETLNQNTYHPCVYVCVFLGVCLCVYSCKNAWVKIFRENMDVMPMVTFVMLFKTDSNTYLK